MYDRVFYDTIRPGVQSSAAVVVPLVMDTIAPKLVVDVGCGEGWWAHEFTGHGCGVIGVDGQYVQGSPLGDRFIGHDLTRPMPPHLAGRFDLAVCLEVAEHLPATRAEGFVADLCGLAPTVLFSAAIPGQGGVGHVNEQPPGYWVGLFAGHGYAVSGALRWQMWNDTRVENWYKANMFVFAQDPDRFPALFDTPLAPPWPVVHPILFDARRA